MDNNKPNKKLPSENELANAILKALLLGGKKPVAAPPTPPKQDRPELPSDMDNFYVYGCPVMVLKNQFARVNASNKAAADRIMRYLYAEGFIEEPKDDAETWK
jgi:hypothetical protein